MQLIILVILIYFSISTHGQIRIMNGQFATVTEFPYQALLRNTTGSFCGGSIMQSRWIMSAAHCDELFENGEIGHVTIVVGTADRSTGGISYAVASFHRHEDYYGSAAANDIGLVRTQNEIIFNEHVKPVRLPFDDSDKFENRLGNVTGWGQLSFNTDTPMLPNNLQYILVKVIDQQSCDRLWGSLNLISYNQICTSIEDGKSPCKGDSGGPLVAHGTQIGIVSFADSDCASQRPTVYTRVSSFLPWIKYQLNLYNEQLLYYY